ncbi:3-methyladenine DNA glycosylase [Micrococcus sp.]|uniref:DNA-3-methyladenine glycosylase family protein n=1 Tax=Micrococcus sp. TaxID=1271 RepID=UPI002A91274B|nr:3-methyladenine DNA glycosylase [Micrococcus sp.]MDY6055193.1 3-methyladenine DNA glycosylase [Micrococcus sp.]
MSPWHASAAEPASPDALRVLRPPVPVDVALTLRPLQRGTADPTVRATSQGVWLTRRERVDGRPLPATLLLQPGPEGTVTVRAWGPAAAAAAGRAEALLGLPDDGWAGFDALLAGGAGRALPAPLREARRRTPGLRLPGAGALAAQLMTVVLEQKVTHDQARHGWRSLVRLAHEVQDATAPGPVPAGMLLPPAPEAVLAVPSWQWHTRAWVQPAQQRALLEVVRRADAVDRLGEATPAWDPAAAAGLARTLLRIPGIGPWTVAEALQRSHGAADLVSVGDFHVAHLVGQVFTGSRTDDAGMLRLLAPWAGHRQRVVRLIGLAGIRKERFGARMAPTDMRRF